MKWEWLHGDSGMLYLVFDLTLTSIFARCHSKIFGQATICELPVSESLLGLCQAAIYRFDFLLFASIFFFFVVRCSRLL